MQVSSQWQKTLNGEIISLFWKVWLWGFWDQRDVYKPSGTKPILAFLVRMNHKCSIKNFSSWDPFEVHRAVICMKEARTEQRLHWKSRVSFRCKMKRSFGIHLIWWKYNGEVEHRRIPSRILPVVLGGENQQLDWGQGVETSHQCEGTSHYGLWTNPS